MNPRPVEVEVIDEKTLKIIFKNGEIKKVDISEFFDLPTFSKLKDYQFFQQAKADGMSVYWNDDIDLDPDYLYQRGISIE